MCTARGYVWDYNLAYGYTAKTWSCQPQFAWTKEGKERRKNKLQELKNIADQQAQ